MTITLQRPATCAECGAALAVGVQARWYRDGTVYGLDCHATQSAGQSQTRPGRRFSPRRRPGEPLGQTYSRLDPGGFYSADGTLLGRSRTCGCEDYPCCGH